MLNKKKSQQAEVEDFLKVAKDLGFGEYHFKNDNKTGLVAVIAIHSTTLGPALGGCRCLTYPSVNAGIVDALRLAQGMSYKAAISRLPLGGGKSVIIRPEHIQDRKALFESFGRFINSLGGRYITAMDSGTSVEDMQVVKTATPYATCTKSKDHPHADPSPLTALGVRRGIEAAVKFRFGDNSLQGKHIAIQGVGHVGYNLAKECHQLGAQLTIADVNKQAVKKCQEDFQAKVVDVDAIHQIECDVFAPCALGSVINADTIKEIKAPIVAGAANNQLAEWRFGRELHERGILYAPDYAVNAGGLIHVASEYFKTSEEQAHLHVEEIYNTLLEIFQGSKQENRPTQEVADAIAEQRLQAGS